MDTNKVSLREITLWVNNDERLYNWWKSSRQPQQKYIKDNREELTKYILSILNKKPQN